MRCPPFFRKVDTWYEAFGGGPPAAGSRLPCVDKGLWSPRGGGAGPGPLTPTPPPSQSGTEVTAVGAEGTGKLIFLLLEALFHPMCLHSKYSDFYGEFNHA